MYETKPYFYGTGRRKDSVARVRVYTGTGKITINDRDIDNYFGLETLKLIVRSPLVLLGLEGKYDVVVRVSGGGVSGQAGAIRHGLSRALLQQSDENRPVLKKAGFLTRDPRMKERKKYGLKAALLRQSRFCCPFPGELGSTTAHLRRLPRKGRAGGAYKSLLKHRVQGAALPAMLPSSPSADYISVCNSTALLRQSRFFVGCILQQ